MDSSLEQKVWLEAGNRRRRAEEFSITCSLGDKSDAEYKLAEAVAELAGAEVAMVDAQLKASSEGTDDHLQLKERRARLMRRWDVALKRCEAIVEHNSNRKRSKEESSSVTTGCGGSAGTAPAQKKPNIGPALASAQQKDLCGAWQWSGDDGVFVGFSEEQSKIIDEKLEKSEFEFVLKIQGQEYRLDLKRRLQIRGSDEGGPSATVRRLRRLCKEMEMPPTWCSQSEPIETFPVSPQEADYTKAENLLFNSGQNATLKCSSFEIVGVRRVQNQLAYERYIAERKNLVKVRGAGEVSWLLFLLNKRFDGV